MNAKSQFAQITQFTLLVALSANLAACQKAKMSSTPQPTPRPAVVNPVRPVLPGTPIVPRPGVPVLPGTVINRPPTVQLPGPVVIPGGSTTTPTTPPGGSTVVIPPRVSPPSQPVNPTTPTLPNETPVVTPVPTQTGPTPVVQTPATPTSPGVPATPAIATPGGGTSTTVIVPAVPNSSVIIGQAPGYVSGGGTLIAEARAPGIGVTPLINGPVRVIRPASVDSKLLKTCVGTSCGQPDQVFTNTCHNSKCNVETIEVVRKEQILCPEIQLRERAQTNKLDILFVVDTSASMIEERTEIANQMTSFIMALNPEVDYRIAILLGHGPESKKSKVGELFNPPDIETTYGVIYKDALETAVAQNLSRPEYNSNAILQKQKDTANFVAKRLAQMMAKVPNDDSKVQGEAGLLNLYTAVTSKLSLMQSRDFWRKDAAKTVIFVADENDVCFDYKTYNQKAHGQNTSSYEMARAKTVDKKDAFKRDPVEIASFNDFNVCQGTANGQQLTAQKVYDAVVASSELPVAFTGVLYTDNARIPKKTDKYLLDNEMGRGYLDVISLGKGLAAELADKDFGRQLAKFGDFANFIRKYDYAFEMRDVVDFNDIDPLTVDVWINTGKGDEHNFNGNFVYLDRDAKTNKIYAVVRYEILKAAYEDGRIDVNTAKIKIYYSTKSGKRPANEPAHTSAAPAAAVSPAAGVAPATDTPAATAAREPHVESQAAGAPAATVDEPSAQASEPAADPDKGRTVYYNIPLLNIKIPGYIKSQKERDEERRNQELYGGG